MLNRLLGAARRLCARVTTETGQTTAEYALVILGAAAVATVLITWATQSDAVSKLFDSVVSKILP
jgi:Flp pilus assembly pilin Flp